jgi:integrase
MRTATKKLTNVTARQKLRKRKKPHYVSVADRLCLGYAARWPKAGIWYGRQKISMGAGYYVDKIWRIGEADDVKPSNSADVLSYGEAFAKVAEGDPRRKRGAQYRVREAIADYLRHLKAETSEAAMTDAEGKLDRWVLKHPIAESAVSTLTVGQMESWRNSLIRYAEGAEPDPDAERRSKEKANRVLNSFKASLNYAMSRQADTGVTSDAGWKGVKRFKDVAARREFHFSIPQLHALIDAADPAFAALSKAGFFTGARYGELKALNVCDFNPKAGQLSVRGVQGGRKTGKRDITLTGEGIEFFRVLVKGRQAEEPLLLAPGAKRWEDGDQTKPMRAALVKAGIVPSEDALDAMPRTERPSFYSLRHSFISRALENGMPIFLVAENVGTSIAMIEKNYGKFMHAAKRKLIEQHAPKLHDRQKGADAIA